MWFRAWVARYGDAAKKAAVMEDEAGNWQPFREFHLITERRRGCGGDYLHCDARRHHIKEAENAEDTSDHDGR